MYSQLPKYVCRKNDHNIVFQEKRPFLRRRLVKTENRQKSDHNLDPTVDKIAITYAMINVEQSSIAMSTLLGCDYSTTCM
jgi:hypothetical protein